MRIIAARMGGLALAAAVMALAAAVMALGASAAGRTRHGSRAVAKRSIAVPAYFDPGAGWKRLDHSHPPLGVAVMNPDSGPGGSRDPAYASTVKTAQKAGVTVVGYVDTAYGKRTISAVEADVSDYYRWYRVNGIFFDNASTSCSEEHYYATLVSYAKSEGKEATTILNPWTATNRCYARTASVLVTFEGSAKQYESSYSAPSWVTDYPASRFWHIVYSAGTVATMQHVVALSRRRRAGYVYVTPAGLPNPYGALPARPYWSAELSAVRG